MQKAKRQAQRARQESLRKDRAERAQKALEERAFRERAVRNALARPVTSARKKVEEWIASGYKVSHQLFPLRTQRRRPGENAIEVWEPSPRFASLLLEVADKAPKIIAPEFMKPLMNLDRFTWVRKPEDWEPEGKSRDTVFRSLVEHLLSEFKTPRFLWTAFFSTDDEKLTPIVDYVAKGGSLYDKVKSGELPVPLTRKMCHEFLQTTTDYTFMSGLRRTQIRTYGGGPQLFHAWMHDMGSRLRNSTDEEFWATVMQFFAKNPLIDYSQVGPLIDYIEHRRHQDPTFSMKGRTVIALMRGMHEWHGDLAKEKAIKGKVFEPSGFDAGSFDRTYQERTGKIRIHWTINEILTSKELAEEGRVLKHCVYSYAYRIGPKTNSIWSMRGNDERVMTIQVDNLAEAIVQYRGRFNALPDARSFQIMKEWADANRLKIGRSGWA